MPPSTLFALAALSAAWVAAAQSTMSFPATPLNKLSFPATTNLPYQIYPESPDFVWERGAQTGYNICNSTTETQSSMCQTMWVNGLDDFCLWAPPSPNTSIGDSEGEEVAWCTKKGYGTRIMEEGTLTGAQLLRTSEYWMITGLIDQTRLNINGTDYGGELDSGGQDERGNPIGGALYSKAFNASPYGQIQWWTEFIGSNMFCIKICNPQSKNEAGYCQHTLDRIGLLYNCPSKYTVPASYRPGEFEICDSALMSVPGIYVDASGTTQSYAQPPGDGDVGPVPYTPTVAASSNCQTYASSALFTELAAATGAASSSAASASVTGSSPMTTIVSHVPAPSASGTAAGSSSGAASRVSPSGFTSLLFSLAAGVVAVGSAIALLN